MSAHPGAWTLREVEARAGGTPDAVAVIDERGPTSFARLWRRTRNVACGLQDAGLTGGELVAVAAPRGAEFIASALGAWLAGCAYVPLDMLNPRARLGAIVEDARPAVLLTAAPFGGSGADLGLTELAVPPADADAGEPAPTTVDSADPVAYVMYTSGTTGAPKGVVVGHASLANLVRWFAGTYDIGPGDRILHTASLGFDASVLEIYPYLASGAGVVACSDEDRMLPDTIAGLCARHGCTSVFISTAMCEQALGVGFAPPGLRYLLTGGDRLRLPGPPPTAFTLVNVYGPTESTVTATMHDVREGGAGDTPPIGRPVGGVLVLLCDPDGVPVPSGEIGELYIGGASLAHGYLRRPDLTRERFVNLPGREGRWYRTGDLAQWSDGVLLFHGRADREQLKVRGVRVEATEIEAALLGVDGITGAAVTTVDANGAGSQGAVATSVLVAVLTAQRRPGVRELRRELVARLPAYLIPERFLFVDRLPLTVNGKLDRPALGDVVREAQAVSDSA